MAWTSSSGAPSSTTGMSICFAASIFSATPPAAVLGDQHRNVIFFQQFQRILFGKRRHCKNEMRFGVCRRPPGIRRIQDSRPATGAEIRNRFLIKGKRIHPGSQQDISGNCRKTSRRLFLAFHPDDPTVIVGHLLPSQPEIRQFQFCADLPHRFRNHLCKGMGRIYYRIHPTQCKAKAIRIQPSHTNHAVLPFQNRFPVFRCRKGGNAVLFRQGGNEICRLARPGNHRKPQPFHACVSGWMQ